MHAARPRPPAKREADGVLMLQHGSRRRGDVVVRPPAQLLSHNRPGDQLSFHRSLPETVER
jgi:hypothetical protein